MDFRSRSEPEGQPAEQEFLRPKAAASFRADMLVEYGPVEIGGKTYFCPIRSVAISKAREPLLFRRRKLSGGRTETFPIALEPPPQTVDLSRGDITLELGPIRTYINDILFTQYHVFRSESRIILDGSR